MNRNILIGTVENPFLIAAMALAVLYCLIQRGGDTSREPDQAWERLLQKKAPGPHPMDPQPIEVKG